MEKIHAAPRRKSSLASLWAFAVACATSWHATRSVSVPFSGQSPAVAQSSSEHGGSQGLVSSFLARRNEEWSNLKEAVWLRNRMGVKLAFVEDPVLTGLLAAQASRGLASRIKAAAKREAQEEARLATDAGKAEEEARALIGPRGGLPALRQDLVRLAALLKVNVTEKMTIPQIKEAVKPMVEILKNKPPSAKEPSVPKAKAKLVPTAVKSAPSMRPFPPPSQAELQLLHQQGSSTS